MVARGSQRFTSEDWIGHWGSDARYYARRRDGACFAIDGAVAVFDLARSAPPASMAQRLPSIPSAGRYDLRLFAAGPLTESVRRDTGTPSERSVRPDAGQTVRRLVVCGVRRSTRG